MTLFDFLNNHYHGNQGVGLTIIILVIIIGITIILTTLAESIGKFGSKK